MIMSRWMITYDDHDHHHHHGHQNNGDEPMVPFNQALHFPDLNMMPEEDHSGAAPLVDVDDKGEEKVVEAQPMEESSQETNRTHTKIPMVKVQWSPQEDISTGESLWSEAMVAHCTEVGRGSREAAAKERWSNHLRSNIKKGVWSLEEDMILIEAHKKFGNKWPQIAKHLPGRTDNTIKNHWHANLRKKRLPRSGSDGDGSNLLWNYIRSLTSSSLLAKNDTTNKGKYTRRNEKLAYYGKQMAADHSNRTKIRNLNMELPSGNENGDQVIGSRGCKMSCLLLFGLDQTDHAGTSKENLGAARKEMDFLGMISHRHA